MENLYRDIEYFENLINQQVVKGDLVLLHNPLVADNFRLIVGSEKYRLFIGRFDHHKERTEMFSFIPGALVYGDPIQINEKLEARKIKLEGSRLNVSCRAESIYVGDAALFSLEDDSEIKRIICGTDPLKEIDEL